MFRLRTLLTAATLGSLAFAALSTTGCTKERTRRVNGPPRTIRVEDFRNTRWYTDDELRQEVARAARSPLVARAVAEEAKDPGLSLYPDGILGATGTAPDGSAVRFIVLPYQFLNDPDRALYFAMVEAKGQARVESFELIRDRKPGPSETGFLPIGEHGLWMRSNAIYVDSPSGVARMAPERWRSDKFASCFMDAADLGIRYANDFCERVMAGYPRCRVIATGVALALVAIFCAFTSWR